MLSNRELSKAVRCEVLGKVNRRINAMCRIHKPLLSKLGRCYYIVSLSNIKQIKIRVMSAEAPLDPTKRCLLVNRDLYSQNSYYGWVKYDDGKCRFERQKKVKEGVTYADGQILFEMTLTGMDDHFSQEDIRAAFKYYRAKKESKK